MSFACVFFLFFKLRRMDMVSLLQMSDSEALIQPKITKSPRAEEETSDKVFPTYESSERVVMATEGTATHNELPTTGGRQHYFRLLAFGGGGLVGETEKHDSNYVMRKSKEVRGKK